MPRVTKNHTSLKTQENISIAQQELDCMTQGTYDNRSNNGISQEITSEEYSVGYDHRSPRNFFPTISTVEYLADTLNNVFEQNNQSKCVATTLNDHQYSDLEENEQTLHKLGQPTRVTTKKETRVQQTK